MRSPRGDLTCPSPSGRMGRRKPFDSKELRQSAPGPGDVSPYVATTYDDSIYFGKFCPILDFICG